MAGVNGTIELGTRFCTVEEKHGYFHTWEHYSKPIPASSLVGGDLLEGSVKSLVSWN